MRLDRNVNPDGRGKYALIKLRMLSDFADPADPFQKIAPNISDALNTLVAAGLIDFGDRPDNEFFVIRLKDKYAKPALEAYASGARHDDPEWAGDIMDLASRAGLNHPNHRKPD